MRVSQLLHVLTNVEYDHIVYLNGRRLGLDEVHQIHDGIGKGIHIIPNDEWNNEWDEVYFKNTNQVEWCCNESRMIFAEALNLLERGFKIRAVKYLREKFDLGLREGVEALNFAVFKWRPELRKLLDGKERLTSEQVAKTTF